MTTTATPELDRLAAALHAHRLRRSCGRAPAYHALEGPTKDALRNEVYAVLLAFSQGEGWAAIGRELQRLKDRQS